LGWPCTAVIIADVQWNNSCVAANAHVLYFKFSKLKWISKKMLIKVTSWINWIVPWENDLSDDMSYILGFSNCCSQTGMSNIWCTSHVSLKWNDKVSEQLVGLHFSLKQCFCFTLYICIYMLITRNKAYFLWHCAHKIGN
jgi:hypothetical protein